MFAAAPPPDDARGREVLYVSMPITADIRHPQHHLVTGSAVQAFV
ncbi:hypothetical protein [Actinomadura rubrisoli]|nr:hypothetical protein [Actinomadura rubrisoli]